MLACEFRQDPASTNSLPDTEAEFALLVIIVLLRLLQERNTPQYPYLYEK